MANPPTAAWNEGEKAPAFSLASSNGQKISLASLKGNPIVLYFYPKDDTPGCTVEAKAFQSKLKEFSRLGVTVLGVSPDSLESHCKFVDKFGLAFQLLSDPDHAVAEKYGVWVEKNMYGKKYWGVQRSTFLIDANGRLAKIWPKVKPEGHAEEVLDAVKAL
ncbi:MAG: peroxiredoxin [Candidatus Hydrogenedentota bacterium]